MRPFFLPYHSSCTPLPLQTIPLHCRRRVFRQPVTPVFTKHATTRLRNRSFRLVMVSNRPLERSLILTSSRESSARNSYGPAHPLPCESCHLLINYELVAVISNPLGAYCTVLHHMHLYFDSINIESLHLACSQIWKTLPWWCL